MIEFTCGSIYNINLKERKWSLIWDVEQIHKNHGIGCRGIADIIILRNVFPE